MDPREIISEIEAYIEASGLTEKTVCQYAFRNPLYLSRLQARVDRLASEQKRFRDFAGKNPPEAFRKIRGAA